MRGYTSRMIAANVSRHTVPVVQEPERAEFESRVYDQAWAARSTHQSVTRFAVLALSADHAADLGRLRLEHQYSPGIVAEMELLENVSLDFEYDRVRHVLQYESLAEREHRRARFAERSVA